MFWKGKYAEIFLFYKHIVFEREKNIGERAIENSCWPLLILLCSDNEPSTNNCRWDIVVAQKI